MTPAPFRARVAGWTALAVAALAPVVAYVGNLGFAPLVAVAGAVAATSLNVRRAPWPAFALVAAIAAFAAASYAWGVVRPDAFPRYHEVEQLTGLKLLLEAALYGCFVLGAADAPPRVARWALLVLAVGFLLVCGVLLAEALGGAALYQHIKRAAHQATRPDLARRNVARGVYAVALVLWPCVLALRARGWTALAVALGIGALAAGVLFRVDAPVVAILVSTLVMAGLRYGGPVVARGVGALVAGLIATAPLLASIPSRALEAEAASGGVVKASWAARLDIWRFVGARIAERPFGWGLDGSRAFPDAIPLHPHDMALQVWLELGAVGAVLACAFWWTVWEGCARLAERDRALGAAAAASAAAYLVIGALSFGVWQEWWLALGALAAAVVAWSRNARASPAERPALYRPAS